jgi:hypothetical protein
VIVTEWQTQPPSIRRHGSIFTSGAYKSTTTGVAFFQEKPHFADLECAE